MFNWFRQSSKSARPHRPAQTRHLKQYVAQQPLSRAEAEAILPGASQLDTMAQQVLGRLPAAIRPAQCCLHHPRMLERLLNSWESPATFRRQLNELLIDSRGNRQGFSFDTLAELSILGDYYNTYVSPLPSDSWAEAKPR